MTIYNNLVGMKPYFSPALFSRSLEQLITKVNEFAQDNKFSLGIGVLSGCFWPGRISAKLAYGIFAFSLSYIWVKTVIQDSVCPCNRYRKQAGVNIRYFLDKPIVERAMERVVTDLKNMKTRDDRGCMINAYERIIEKYGDAKSFFSDVNSVIAALKGGTCLGQAIALLTNIPKLYSSNTQDLFRVLKENRENVVYAQIMNRMRYSFICEDSSLTEKSNSMWSNLFSFVGLDAFSNKPPVKVSTNPIDIWAADETLSKIIIPGIRNSKWSNRLSISIATPDDYEKAFDEATSNFSREKIISGYIFLSNKKEGEAGHAIWFQCSGDKFRFYDPLNDSQGFFEFPSKKEFFASLARHLNGVYSSMIKETYMLCYEIEK